MSLKVVETLKIDQNIFAFEFLHVLNMKFNVSRPKKLSKIWKYLNILNTELIRRLQDFKLLTQCLKQFYQKILSQIIK